ncbi:MAG: MoxR family ATPase [Chlamydiales bacterium]|nr:MoxR family ATPase [Chlamydiales bacterium]
MPEDRRQIERVSAFLEQARQEIGLMIVGQKELIERLLIALLAKGHLLLEGMPGLAKTLSIKTLAKVVQAQFSRVQFTPDLLPADIIGTSIYNPKEASFAIKKGPIFTDILLADEINRAPPKVQSALLEAMAEGQVSLSGETHTLPFFFVMATQNPVEQEGTFPLPEAQMDRFLMKVLLSYPSHAEEKEILNSQGRQVAPKAVLSLDMIQEAQKLTDSIFIEENVLDYILSIIFATRDPKRYGLDIAQYLQYGASPRASLALKKASQAHALLAGRGHVTPHDVKSVAKDILRHRLILSYEAQAEEIDADHLIEKILSGIQVP